MKSSIAALILLGFLLAGANCGDAPKVIQGTVSEYQAESHTLVVKNEREPYQDYSFSVDGSDMGEAPAVGDKIRVAYREENGRLKAIRVMNLARVE
jgi:hypothetical protein